MDINEMQAGRETDCKVALVLGWSNIREEFVRGVSCEGQNMWFGDLDENHKGELLPWFSEDLKAAWLLVDLIKQGNGGCPLFSLKLDRFEGNQWECLMGVMAGEGTWWVDGEADTPELAICRAFLKSKEPRT